MPTRTKPSVKLDDGIYWIAIKLAAEKSGLTKPELQRRAIAGAIRFQPDSFGKPVWFAEPDINELRVAKMNREAAAAKRPPRKKSLKQLEKQWSQDSDTPGFRPMTRGGGVSKHYEKVLLSEIALSNEARKQQKSES